MADMSEKKGRNGGCPVFGVESGGPLIGLGILMILFGIIPNLIGIPGTFPFFITVLLIVFGIFLIWSGLTR